jgi:hypothetical protein
VEEAGQAAEDHRVHAAHDPAIVRNWALWLCDSRELCTAAEKARP